MTRILLVEDEENYRDPLALGLRRDGFEVVEAQDGITAVERFEAAGRADGADPIDLVLLDLMLPRLSGTEVCRRIRRASRVPVIMLTAKDSEVDKVVGLEIGADDYVTKPYSYRELLARVHAVLRRSHEDGPYDRLLSADRVVMDLERHEVRVDGEAVTMPLREFELLELFLRHPDRVLARSQIIEQIWGANYVGDTKTLDVHVKRIRAKIEVEPSAPSPAADHRARSGVHAGLRRGGPGGRLRADDAAGAADPSGSEPVRARARCSAAGCRPGTRFRAGVGAPGG